MRPAWLLVVTAFLLVPAAAADPLVLHADDVLVLDPTTTLRSLDGLDATAVRGSGLVVAADGGHGQDIILDAPLIITNGAHIDLGSGGDGGDATSIALPGQPDAHAIAGDGGRGGRLIILGDVVGNLFVTGGHGGAGGTARAQGLDADQQGTSTNGADADCDASDGEPDRQFGADGGTGAPGSSAEARGEDGGCAAPDMTGGTGGEAIAEGGNGGTAGGSGGNGGDGGNAIAIAGTGGPGLDACFPAYSLAEDSGITRAGDGGSGGKAEATGGAGGQGVNGGNGGDAEAYSTGGRGGNATNPPIDYGTGGPVAPGLAATGGNAGTGVVNGGNGGSATSIGTGGQNGGVCPGFEGAEGGTTPGPGVPLFGLLLVALLGASRRRLI